MRKRAAIDSSGKAAAGTPLAECCIRWGRSARFVERVRAAGLISDEHFTVDGTLLDAWASLKSFQPKDKQDAPPDDPGNPTVNFHGQERSNETHESKTDPHALLARKGQGKE